MEKYANLSGRSSAREFEIYDRAIIIGFKEGSYYLYDYTKPGRENVETMKKLAREGKGLVNFVKSNDKNAGAYRAKTRGYDNSNTLDELRAMVSQS